MLNNAREIELLRNEASIVAEKIRVLAIITNFYCFNQMGQNSQLSNQDVNIVFRIIEKEAEEIAQTLEEIDKLLLVNN